MCQIENIEHTEYESVAYREERVGCPQENAVSDLLG